MTRELFTSTTPTEPGMYWWSSRNNGINTISQLFDAPYYGMRMRLMGMVDWVKPHGTFGPRIPSPSELAGNTTNEEKSCES